MKKWLIKFTLTLFAVHIALGLASAADTTAAFDAANKLYEQGRFGDSAAAWKELIKAGTVSAAMYYNEGNAFFKAGQTGQAIAAYRHALLLTPRDGDIRKNLNMARQQAQSGFTPASGRWEKLPGYLSLNEWSLLAGIALFATFSILAAKQLNPQWFLGNYFKMAVVSLLLFGSGLAWALENDYFAEIAIITVGEAEIHNGPLDESPTLFKLRDGLELKVTDQKNGWYQVRDAAYRSGWVRPDQVIIFHPAGAPQTK